MKNVDDKDLDKVSGGIGSDQSTPSAGVGPGEGTLDGDRPTDGDHDSGATGGGGATSGGNQNIF